MITLNCMMKHAPWGKLGLDTSAAANSSWERQAFTFAADGDDDRARITPIVPLEGLHELADVSLRPGGTMGLAPGQSLEDGTVPPVRRREFRVTPQALHGFIDFARETEADCWRAMYRGTRGDLKARSLVAGTRLSASPVSIQAELDYTDSHEYWHHPIFLRGRSWDKSSAWYVANEALVNSPAGGVGRMASRRITGMACTVSEYDHPEPDQFTAEGFPMVAAIAAFQDWAGVFSFAHSHDTDYEPNFMTGFFCFEASPHSLVHMPAYAATFRRGDLARAHRTVATPTTPARERELLHELPDPTRLVTDTLSLGSRWSLWHGIELKLPGYTTELAGTPDQAFSSEGQVDSERRFVSDTGQMAWDVTRPGRGVLTAITPRTRLFTGFADGRQFTLAGLELAEIESRTGAATISVVCIDGDDPQSPGRVLLAASSAARNTGAVLGKPQDDRVTLRKGWGKGPVVCEGISAAVHLPTPPARINAYALNGDGRRIGAIPATSVVGKTLLGLSPTYHTLWYE